jgi:hypothetical protein
MHRQLVLFQKSMAAYFSGNEQELNETLAKLQLPNSN